MTRKERMRKRIEQDTCPYCGAGKLELSYENVEIDGAEAHQSVSCMACERNFTEVYGFKALILPDAPDIGRIDL